MGGHSRLSGSKWSRAALSVEGIWGLGQRVGCKREFGTEDWGAGGSVGSVMELTWRRWGEDLGGSLGKKFRGEKVRGIRQALAGSSSSLRPAAAAGAPGGTCDQCPFLQGHQ